MAQVFPKTANEFARASLVVGGIVAAAVVGSFFFVWPRSSYMTRQHEARAQPVPFSHAHHVGGLGIDCRYCHTAVEKSAVAGHPADQDLHELPLADLQGQPDARAGARELARPARRSSG